MQEPSMRRFKMKGSVDSIESFGLVDGPGIRTVIFFNGCKLRCKYCHNPEMWQIKDKNMSVEEVVSKVLRNKPYFTRNHGGVTLSGGEPLLQVDFLLALCKRLKKENIHIALDTAGVGVGRYEEILSYVDLVLLDIKHVKEACYQELTGLEMKESLRFIEALNKSGKTVWIRQVIVPGMMDSVSYLKDLNNFLKNIQNIERIDFLPYHKLGQEKYELLSIPNPYQKMPEMDKEKCEKLYQEFMKIYREDC